MRIDEYFLFSKASYIKITKFLNTSSYSGLKLKKSYYIWGDSNDLYILANNNVEVSILPNMQYWDFSLLDKFKYPIC